MRATSLHSFPYGPLIPYFSCIIDRNSFTMHRTSRRRPELKFNHFIAVLVSCQLLTSASPPTAQAFRSQQQSHQLQSSHSNGSHGSAGGASNPDKEKHVRTMDIDAVEGRMVSLPCPISAPLEDVYMVLWFRDNAGIPLYSFDVRNKLSTDEPRHWSAPEVFGSRAKFNFDSTPASLDIKDIKRHDQGIYRCRIDFRTSQTQSYRFNLTVIILPEQPIILNRWGQVLNGTELGPKQEGDDIVITCRVVGGRPQPQVRWLINGLLVDNQNEHNSGDVIENRLLWPSVQRNDLHSVFTCQAVNTDLVKPKERSFILDMRLKPLTVNITNAPHSMVADRRYEVICESTGSRPAAIITWYKGKRQLRRTKDDVIFNNTTRSELSFVPTTDDDGKHLTCRAENPNVNGLYLETSWKLNVVYPPLVSLRLGSTLTPDDIKEGDDVYFECHVQSNPPWRKLLWLHNGIHLEHNTSARVIRSNQSLVLQKITRFYAGNYACSAINDEGETVSNHLPLRVKYTPICKYSDRVILIGASKDETVEVACEIQADPPPRNFRWKFNNSGETLDVGSERYTINGTRSVLKYTPVTDQDYGTLSCWATNEVGTQHHPCMFQVVLAVLPNAVSNCTLYNRTELSVEIQCIPGYDGGLPQMFVLEMFSTKTGSTRFNVTNPDEPQFILDNLDTLTTMMTTENNSLKVRVYAVNQKGRSPSYSLHDFVVGYTSLKTESDASLTLSPVFVGTVLTIIVISLVIALRIFITTFLQNLKRNRQQNSKAPVCGTLQQTMKSDSFKKGGNIEKPRWQHTDIKTKSSADDIIEDERDPDVIPSQFAGSGGGGGGGNSLIANDVNGDHHHFTPPPITKWSPSANHTMYDTVLQANIVNSPGGIPAYNQINTRPHLAATGLNPSGATSLLIGCSPSNHTMASPIGSVSSQSTAVLAAASTSSPTPHVISNVLASTTVLGGSGGLGLPNGPSTIRTAAGRIITVPGSGGGTATSILSTTSSNGTGGGTSLLGSSIGSVGSNSTSLTTTDLEDININAIKDCLMTQRVPESCV